MACVSSLDTSITQDCDEFQIDSQEFKILKTSKKKDSILHDGFYYNHMRDNKSSTVFKCRHIVDVEKKRECTGNFTLQKDGKTFKVKEHQHEPMEPIQCEVMLALAEIDELILANPTQSIKNIYNQKEIDLVGKFGASLVATHWPEFESKDSAYFAHKNKIVPKLPQNIDDLKDLPSHYQQTTTKQRFLASPIDLMCKYLLLVSLIGLTILSKSEKWWCDGTFKTAPKFYYQHYIIHGKYNNAWPLPGMFSFMSGKSYELYAMMLNNLKECAAEVGLVLKPKIISCDFEKGAIKAFKLAFPGVKIQGCHFHFTSAIHKKIVDLGLKTIYSGENHNEDFTVWVRMLMAFPFLMMNDIDEAWDEMIDSKPILDDESKVTFEKFIKYFEETWIEDKCHFPRELWNMFDIYSSRTNNISETYNHSINSQVMSAKSNVFKVLDLAQKQETLTSVKYERVNQGKEKKQTNSQRVKDSEIAVLKLKYKHGELEVMDYLMKVSVYSKNYY